MSESQRDRELIQKIRVMIAFQTDCIISECDELRGPDVYCGCERDAIKIIAEVRETETPNPDDRTGGPTDGAPS